MAAYKLVKPFKDQGIYLQLLGADLRFLGNISEVSQCCHAVYIKACIASQYICKDDITEFILFCLYPFRREQEQWNIQVLGMT